MHRLLNLVSYNSHVQRVVHVVMLDSQLKERPILSIRRLTSQHDCVSFVKASPLHIVNNRDAPDIRPFFSVMWIRLNYYTDPDPGSGNPPYKSGSKEKTSQNSIFQNFVEKTYVYKIG